MIHNEQFDQELIPRPGDLYIFTVPDLSVRIVISVKPYLRSGYFNVTWLIFNSTSTYSKITSFYYSMIDFEAMAKSRVAT